MSDLYKAISGLIGDKIEYFENLRTGEITVDNGDGTYDVKIANADSAYPNVETLDNDMTFSIKEIVVIGFEYGCKESPKILGTAKKIAQEPLIVEVDYSGGARVKTLNAYSITETTTYLNGEISITANIIGNSTRRGFHYGIDTDYGLDEYEDGSFGAGTYTLQIEGLNANTTYHYQAYVIDANGDEQVGEDKTMTTTTSVLTHKIYIVCDNGSGTYYIKSYSNSGILADTWTIETTENIGNAICVDENENVYTITSDQHHIKKRSSTGVLTLTKTETHWVYGIVVGADGYIYTFELKNDSSTNQISKRNASDLTIVSSKNMGSTDTYYGFAIDSDGDFYLMNTSGTDEYERWDFTSGLVSSVVANHGTFNSLGIVGTKLADVHWLNHALTRLKDLSGGESDVELEDMTSPGACGSMEGEYFLYTGYGASSMLVLGKYDTTLTKVWTVVVPDSAAYSYGSIAAYPF